MIFYFLCLLFCDQFIIFKKFLLLSVFLREIIQYFKLFSLLTTDKKIYFKEKKSENY